MSVLCKEELSEEPTSFSAGESTPTPHSNVQLRQLLVSGRSDLQSIESLSVGSASSGQRTPGAGPAGPDPLSAAVPAHPHPPPPPQANRLPLPPPSLPPVSYSPSSAPYASYNIGWARSDDEGRCLEHSDQSTVAGPSQALGAYAVYSPGDSEATASAHAPLPLPNVSFAGDLGAPFPAAASMSPTARVPPVSGPPPMLQGAELDAALMASRAAPPAAEMAAAAHFSPAMFLPPDSVPHANDPYYASNRVHEVYAGLPGMDVSVSAANAFAASPDGTTVQYDAAILPPPNFVSSAGSMPYDGVFNYVHYHQQNQQQHQQQQQHLQQQQQQQQIQQQLQTSEVVIDGYLQRRPEQAELGACAPHALPSAAQLHAMTSPCHEHSPIYEDNSREHTDHWLLHQQQPQQPQQQQQQQQQHQQQQQQQTHHQQPHQSHHLSSSSSSSDQQKDRRNRNSSASVARNSSVSGNPNGQIQLWHFILRELENFESQDVLCWTGDGWEFRFKDPEKVAKKWGDMKNKPSMNYEKMSRGLRYYYDKDIIRKSGSGGRYHYKFTEKKMREHTHLPPSDYFQHHGITPQKEEGNK